ncbi:MAG TPA: GNAT family N-acetyltransferase [Acidothermaceae bacterium]|nr:GNAT family N-acetyltransferase [Acidothermaceae bacterium]
MRRRTRLTGRPARAPEPGGKAGPSAGGGRGQLLRRPTDSSPCPASFHVGGNCARHLTGRPTKSPHDCRCDRSGRDDRRRRRHRRHLPALRARDRHLLRGDASPHKTRASYRWSADVSVYVAPGERGRGVGRLLYGELLPLVRGLGYVSVFAGITLPNDASVGFHEAFGLTPVGVYRNVGFKHNKWRDVGWWQLTFTDPPDQPAEPRPWTPPDLT